MPTAGLVVCLRFVAACASDEPGISPDVDRFYFPTGIALHRWDDEGEERTWLFVANSNADLRYNSGTLTAVDLSRLPGAMSDVAQAVADGEIDCRPDRVDPTRWECPQPAADPTKSLILPDATVRIGDFPADIKMVARSGADTPPPRVVVPVRGRSQLVWADVVHLHGGGVDLRCSDECNSSADRNADCEVWDCDARHRVTRSNAEHLDGPLPEEPFGIAVNLAVPVDPDQGADSEVVDHIYLTHLQGGEVSFLVSDNDGVELKDVREGFFESDGSAVGGAYALALSTPGSATDPIYVSSRFDGDLASFVIAGNQRIIPAGRFALGAIAPPGGGVADLRDIAFDVEHQRLFVVSRTPPALVGIQVVETDGERRYEQLWATEVCTDPSFVRLAPNLEAAGTDVPPLAYVVCFGAGEIFVVDTVQGTLVDQIATGRGPNGLELDVGTAVACDTTCLRSDEVCSNGRCVKRHPRAFVANFLENTVGVIDLDPSSRTYLRMQLRIGQRRTLVVEE